MGSMLILGMLECRMSEIDSPSCKLVYLFVHNRDFVTLNDLCKQLDMTKATALSLVRELRRMGFVEKLEHSSECRVRVKHA